MRQDLRMIMLICSVWKNHCVHILKKQTTSYLFSIPKFHFNSYKLQDVKKESGIFEKLLALEKDKLVKETGPNNNRCSDKGCDKGSDIDNDKSNDQNNKTNNWEGLEIEKVWTKELVCTYKEYIKKNFENIKKVLKKIKGNNKYEQYAYECIQTKEYKDLLIADVIYENKKNILCIGDGNLSFSSMLQKELSSSNVVATSIEEKKDLIKSYGTIFQKNFKTLISNGGIYIPAVNLEKMENHFLKETFDVIIFNFPFVIPTKEFIEEKWKVKLDYTISEEKNFENAKHFENDNTEHFEEMKHLGTNQNINTNSLNRNSKNNKNNKNNKNKNEFIKFYKKAEYFLLNKLIYHLFKNSSYFLKKNGYLHLRINDKYLTCSFPSDLSLSFLQKIDFYNSSIFYKTLKYVPSIFNYNTETHIHNQKKRRNMIFTDHGIFVKTFKMKHTSTLVFQKEM